MLLLAHRSFPGTLISRAVSGRVWDGTMFSLVRTLFSPGSAEDRSSLQHILGFGGARAVTVVRDRTKVAQLMEFHVSARSPASLASFHYGCHSDDGLDPWQVWG